MWRSTAGNNCNTYLIDGPTRVLIDPGHSNFFDHVRTGLDELGLALDDIGLIICTHAHPDHLEAVQLFRKKPALVTLHLREWQFLKTMDKHTGASLGVGAQSVDPDFFLKEGDLAVHGIDLKVFHTPGHSPGSVSLYWPLQKLLFTGDLIFKAGIGRTDLPGGNGSLLKRSIKRLTELEIEWILPGHGDIIGGAKEIKANFNQLQKVWF
ncbi:MAG: MBL fold metallo-hydrolase [Proteobacteria bacterium]|nr:MBL fold metallo-hydrolase [Pseudomonadota bacterium]